MKKTISLDELQKRDAIIAALCAKLGVDASSVINPSSTVPEVPTSVSSSPATRKPRQINYDSNHAKAIEEVKNLPEGKLSLNGVRIVNNGYQSDVIVGLAPVSNYLTRTLVDCFAVAPYRERLRLGGTSDTERIAGWSVSRRWSRAVQELLTMLTAYKQDGKRESIVQSYVSSHQDLILAIREWQGLKWSKTAYARKRKNALKSIFEAYGSILANDFVKVQDITSEAA